MNQVKKFDLEYSYDSEVDSIHIRITDKYEYKESLELEDGIILDFSTEGIPVSLEILDISDLFSVDKECFENIENINISIDITNFRISLNLLIEVLIKNEIVNRPFSTIAKNDINIPEMNVICSC
ncbi:MAG: DUF2283 domain-containing protein [Methanobrevibacter thaueri]|jgi:uncharacterized protein YuzE|uniref:DUF2283 domain-containing protein n=1 Tax=Methanobrevibacter thaueri TaxID=190975 RepID=UPI0026EA8B19|nr:DUF2283 domain-containing protein [Methanobrevibacter thaueri]MBE6496559.1 DUF2283 domain-containing protein [Methanobrevibacter thaueri]